MISSPVAPLLAAVSPKLAAWLTPLWIFGLGALAGLVTLVLLWGLLFLVHRRAALAAPVVIRDGVLYPVLWIAVGIAAISVLGPFVVAEPLAMIQSMQRLGTEESWDREFSVEGGNEAQELQVQFLGDELRQLRLEASEPLLVSSRPEPSEDAESTIEVEAVEPYLWTKGEETVSPLGRAQIERLWVVSLSGLPTTLKMHVETAPVYPQMGMVPITAVSLVGLFLLYLAQHAFFPKISAVSLATSKSEVVQPLYLILLSLGIFLIIIFTYIPYNTFGEDIKMLKDSGFALILVFGLIQAVWAASNSVAEEIEGRTALTVLSKPIGRRQFILGKFLGIVWSVGLLFFVLGVTLLVVVAYKPVYDARETSNLPPGWETCYREMALTVPGLVLAFLETVVLAAISVAISTRLPLLANFSIMFSIYVLGHLTPTIVKSSMADFEPVAFVGQLIATVLPVLEHFNISAAVSAGKPVPIEYLATATLTCILYTTVAMLLALTFFEDRDLA